MCTEESKIARNKRRNARRKLRILVAKRNREEARKSVPSYRKVKRPRGKDAK